MDRNIPDDVETNCDTFFFKDSPVRREEFLKLNELVEPDSPHVALVLYHRVRWLSLADCVERLTQLLPLLVRYFDEQAEDMANSTTVRAKSRALHARFSEPLFQLYLFSLAHSLIPSLS